MSEQSTNTVEHSQDGVRHTLRIVVPAEAMADRVDAATRAFRNHANLPGFRAGKAPLGMVRQQFGKDIRQRVLDHALPEILSNELEARELRPLDSPALENVQFEPGTDLDFTVRFDTAPEIKADNLEMSATRQTVEVTDEMVDEALDQLRERGARLVPAEAGAGAAEEMFARCEITLRPKDGKGKKLAEDNRFVRVGNEQAIPALDDELPGMREGDTKEFVARLSEQFPNAILAGKEAPVQLHVAELKVRQLPELDDDFAKDLGLEGLATLRERVREDIQNNLEGEAARALDSQLLTQLRENNPVEVPDSLIEHRLDEMSRRFASDLQQQGVDPRDAIDWRAFRQEQRGAAADSIAEELLLDKVAADQEITVDDDAVEDEIRTQMERREGGKERPVVSVIQQMRKDGSFDSLRLTMQRRLALEHLRAHATIDSDSGGNASNDGADSE